MEAEVGNQRHTPNSPKSETQSQMPRVTNPIQTSENINLPISSHNMSLPTSQLSTSRSLEICPSKLGSNYFQYLDTRSHLRPQITIPYPTRPIIFPRAQSTSLQLNTGQCHQPGDHPITNQGSHSGVQAGKSSLPEPNLYRPEDGQEMAPDIRSKGHKHLLTPSPFQDGVNQESHNNSSTRALYGSSGPEGCLPINSGFSILPEVSCIQMEGEGIRLSGNAFRPINCPQSFYQSNASTDHSLARTGTTYVSIPGRHSISFGLVHDSTILPRSYNLPPFEALGFQINREKSHLVPTQSLTFLGFVINTTPTCLLSLTVERVTRVKKLASDILRRKYFPIRTLATFLGLLESTRKVIPSAPLRMRLLQVEYRQALRRNSRKYNSLMSLSAQARQAVISWRQMISTQIQQPIHLPTDPYIVLYTDASLQGWGAVLQEPVSRSTSGEWTVEESVLHINILELLAVLYALQAFWPMLSLTVKIPTLSRINTLIYSDNRTVVAYINNMGGTHSIPLLRSAQKLWTWSLERKIWLQSHYLPGKQNIEADRCSRTQDASNWRLKRQVFLTFAQMYGPFPVDLFASRTNTQLPVFFSWKPDPQASQVDAMIQYWPPNSYAFPPFSLIEAVLHKIHRENLMIMLIAPLWRGQVWYPRMIEMLIDHPIMLPLDEDLLLSPLELRHPLIQDRSLTLGAFRLSGDSALQRAFQSKLPPSLSTQHRTQQRELITQDGINSLAGVRDNKLILFRPLPQR